MKEKDIIFETTCQGFWVGDLKDSYAVFIDKGTHSESDSHYRRNADGLSIAIARAKYLSKRKESKK